jgi:hypothetical protein
MWPTIGGDPLGLGYSDDFAGGWEVVGGGVHVGLDVVGLVPGVGEIADGINAAIYTIEGDYENATISTASMIPGLGAGATAGKYGKRALMAGAEVGVKSARRVATGGKLAPPGSGLTLGAVKRNTTANSTVGWRVGDPINNLTAAGRVPSWSAVRQRFWKNEALNNSGHYTQLQLARMRRGRAPQQINPRTGKLESKHLHHDPPQREGGLFDIEPFWPDQHMQKHYPGCF